MTSKNQSIVGNGIQFPRPVIGANLQGKPAADERPKSKYWLNVGYNVPNGSEDGKSDLFVSLNYGIPLDSVEKMKITGSNKHYQSLLGARNCLLEDLLAQAATMQPGETLIIGGADDGSGLAIQLRHVNEEVAEVDPDNNPLVRRFGMSAVQA